MKRAILAALASGLVACGGGDGFSAPTDIAFLLDGSPLIADGDNGRLVQYSNRDTYVGTLSSEGGGDGELDLPHGVAVGLNDTIYVADRGNARVQIFDTAGNVLNVWDSSVVGRPWAIAYHDELVYVVDGGDEDPAAPFGRVTVLDEAGGIVTSFGRHGTGPARFAEASDVAVDEFGAVYVGDRLQRTVHKFEPVMPAP